MEQRNANDINVVESFQVRAVGEIHKIQREHRTKQIGTEYWQTENSTLT